jgi:hypothetical protein
MCTLKKKKGRPRGHRAGNPVPEASREGHGLRSKYCRRRGIGCIIFLVINLLWDSLDVIYVPGGLHIAIEQAPYALKSVSEQPELSIECDLPE